MGRTYILSSLAGVSQYFLVYGQQLFNLEMDADTGPTPTPPSTFTANMCPISGVVVTDSDPSSPLALSRFRDIRPTLSFRSDGTTASADHNSLLNLTVGNAHPQYFRVDGTSVMAGNINLDGQNIIGTGGNLLNGVDITAHAARHLPGGPDALTTAMPVSVGSSNAIGAAAAFSRSGHVHNHGAQTNPGQHAPVTALANGFMISTDKSKLDASTELDVSSTLVQRDANGMIQITELQIQSDSTIYHLALKASPSGFGGPHHNIFFPVPATGDTIVYLNHAQTLTNKTIVGSTNIVAASQLQTTGADVIISGAAPPAVNNILITTSPTTAAWGTVPNAALTNSSVTVTAGTGLSGGGTVSLGGSTTLNNSGVLSIRANAGAAEVGALTLANGTNVSIVDSPAGTFTFNVPTGAGGVTTWSAGTTGFTPSSATSGAVILSGTLVAVNGGTGISSYATGDLLYANTTTTLAKLADVAAGSYLRSGGVSTAPVWSTLTLPNSSTTGDILYSSATNTINTLADVAVGNALISGGVGVAPSWGKISNATLTNSSITITAGSGLSGGGTVSLGGSVTLTNINSGGTVTSVGLTMPAEFAVSGTPVTTTGTFGVTKANQNANFVWAGPTSGAAAPPTFRAIVSADIVGASVITRQFVGTANLVQTPASDTFVTMFPTGVGSTTITANILTPGTMIFFRIGGTFGSTSSANGTLRMTLGGLAVATSAATSLGTNANVHMTVDGYYTVRTTGVSGTVVGDCMLFSASSSTNPNLVGTTTTTSTVIDTTTALTVDVQFKYAAAFAANTFTVVNAVIWYGSA